MNNNSYIKAIPFTGFGLFKATCSLSRLDMELTERCNNNCMHCYINRPADDAEAQKLEMNFEQIQKILQEAACLGCQFVRFTGGEPLLRYDFEDIYLYARKLGLKVELFTNGTLITPRLARLFQRIPTGDSIQISLYGHTRESYEATSRRPHSFSAVQKGMSLLMDNNVPFVVNAVLLPLKIDTFSAFEAWAKTKTDLNIPQPPVTTLHLRCRGRDARKNDLIKALRLPAPEQLQLEARKPESYDTGLQKFCSKFCRIPGDTLFSCSAGIGRGCVDAYGTLQLCMLLRHPETVYDLKNGSLAEALQTFFPRIRQKKARNAVYLERCARCFLFDLCEQCPAVSWMENRMLDGWSEHFCLFTHAQARRIGLLREGEKSWMIADWKERIKGLSNPIHSYNNKEKFTKQAYAEVSL
ncbi:radical SAM protein [candidate division KSB1 bacterium]|nr:radical SAM protein [candidate division KSB1 bacterium]